MKKNILTILFFSICLTSFSQNKSYWQQTTNYFIDVTLNDTAKTLDGHLQIAYANHSPDTLHFIWFHIWPNAYKNDRTAFSDQLLTNGRTDFYFSTEDKRGYINRLDFKVNHVSASIEDHPQHQDIIKLILPNPLLPGEIATIETPFHVKLPFNFSRGGYINNSFQITQWYPKPAVYDSKGWHEMPYLDQGEFYSEFGEYTVRINVPQSYLVAATGDLQSEEINDNIKTLKFNQTNVHDFAWFADKDFMIQKDTLQLKNKIIDVSVYYYKNKTEDWKNSILYLKRAILTKSQWLGEYPYNKACVVERPDIGGGGMEYPTITLISNPENEKDLDLVINHEVGHNWFYGILGSNERLHPWMDEGMNTYYDQRYENEYYHQTNKSNNKKPTFINQRWPDEIEQTILEGVIHSQKDQAIENESDAFSATNYGLIAYIKTAQWLNRLEENIGSALFDSVMKAYYRTWQFKHPYPENFKLIAEETTHQNLDSQFSLLAKKGSLMPTEKKSMKVMSFFSLKETAKYNYLFIAPAFGYNLYDKMMLGLLLHNYTLPFSRFQYAIAPLYATGTKSVNGIGNASYTYYPSNDGRNIVLSIAAMNFTRGSFTDSTNTKNYLRFSKITPSIKYTFQNKQSTSTQTTFIRFKSNFIKETELNFSRDTVQQINIITYPKQSRTINQLQFATENTRALYPYSASFQADQGKGFIRLQLTGSYFFNYPTTGGLNVRFFAGKFMYTKEKTYLSQYQTDNYHLNMSGAKGYEDYTYSNYFIGRNEYDGMANQQIMIKDGAFKVRTDLLSNKIGKTDNWLTAINLTTSIPKEINPLEVLPIKLPLKIFVDIGTYAEAWKKDASTGKFLYDAGLQLCLFNNIVNIYFPIMYSKVYADYFKSTITEKRFLKNISFSIDIEKLTFKKLFPQSPF